ncbi:MAG: hypothetical protein ACRCZE_03365, partial [Candidatus Altimarinota bacterium]
HPLVLAARQAWTQKTPLYQGYSLGLFTAYLSLLIHSNFVNSLLFPQIMIFFFISTALLFLTTFTAQKVTKNQLQ